jgi:hypothetical protein
MTLASAEQARFEGSVCGPKTGGLASFRSRRPSTNKLIITLALAVLLFASAEAEELVSPDDGGCAYGTESGRAAEKRVYTGQATFE